MLAIPGFSSSACFLVLTSILSWVKRAASLIFCPFLPIASDKLSPSATAKASFFFSSSTYTDTSFAGESAFLINSTGSLSYFTTSIFSPFNSWVIWLILDPFSPIHAPTASTLGFSEYTAILLLWPASRATL